MTDCDIHAITHALSAIRLESVPGEYDIHTLVANVLQQDGIPYAHEVSLGPRCRIDFLCGSIGIEVKKGHPTPTVVKKQLQRYLASDAVSAIVLVSENGISLPGLIGGKPVTMISLNRFWGIALP